MDANEQEKKNRRIGFLTSFGIHSAIFLALFFLIAWRAPDPPLPEFGIELNFGMDTQGSGDVQPEVPVGEETEKESDTQDTPTESQPEEVKEVVKETLKEIVPEKAIEQAVSEEPSPVVVKEEKKKEVKKEVVKEKPAESAPKVIAEYKKEEKKESTSEDASKKGKPGNQGDDTNKAGDKGSPEGKLDAKALYGTPGGGGGGNGLGLSMGGWAWAIDPKVPELPDNENGKIVFEIECDENGDITDIKTIERSLSPRSEKLLKDEILRNSLVRTAGERAPERSRGRIVFILKSK